MIETNPGLINLRLVRLIQVNYPQFPTGYSSVRYL